jgi:outer membrane protein insertion porin family
MAWRMYLVLLLLASPTLAQKSELSPVFPIDSITIEGNRILSAAAILNVSGLKQGAPGDSAAFDAARDRLLASGYFETVSYRYKPAAGGKHGFEVTFTVAEETKMFPLRVDALGVTTEEVAAYLKTTDPLFTGRLPGTKPVLDRATRAIEGYLEIRQRPARVLGRVVTLSPNRFEIQFTPERGLPAVSIVTFEGTKVISAPDLRGKIGEVAFGQPYTEDGFRVFLENQIRPLYEAKGYMHVTFPKIVSAPAADVQGVDVQVTVDEGDRYSLSKVTFGGRMGNARLPDLKITNFDQVKDGTERILQSMRHQGYLDADVSNENERDDAKKAVELTIVVDPGPEYTFGKLTVLGLSLDGEAAIRKMWAVGKGDPFPQEYPDIFVKRVKDESLFDNLGELKASPKIDRDSHVADVTLDFKYGAELKNNGRRGRGPVY